MIDQLVMDAPERADYKIDRLRLSEQDPLHDATVQVGARAIEWTRVLNNRIPAEHVDMNVGPIGDVDMKNKTSNPEGSRNAELFKQAYDTVIESIDRVFASDGTHPGDKLVAVLHNIDVLSGTPYISSAPEFVDLVKAARNNVEQVRAIINSDNSPEMNLAVVGSALSKAKQQLAGTMVAYRP